MADPNSWGSVVQFIRKLGFVIQSLRPILRNYLKSQMQLTQLELCTVKIITFECGIATFWSKLTLQLIAWNINFLCSRRALSQVGRYGSFVGCPIRRYIFDDKKILKRIFSFSQKSSVWNDSGFRQKDLEVHMSLSQGFFNDWI